MEVLHGASGNVAVLAGGRIASFSPSLHALRGIAALAVCLFHWEQFFPEATKWAQQFFPSDTLLDPTVYIGFGWMGVPLFFVLSGWLLGGQVIDHAITFSFLKRFWLRRFLRIYPAVWVELVVILAVAMVVPGLVNPESYDNLALQFLLWLNLPPVMATPLNGVWWTLPVELGFYLCLPLVGVATAWCRWPILLGGSLLVTLMWRYWIFTSSDVQNYVVVLPVLDALPGVFFTFMLGFSLNFLAPSRLAMTRALVIVIASIILLLLMQWQLNLDYVYWTGHWILVVWPPLVAFAVALLAYSLRYPPVGFGWLTSAPLIWLGHVSFGIYLWHFQVFQIFRLIFPEVWGSPISSVWALLIALPLTLILASLSYYLVERPLMGWGKKVVA